jgi:hypothetical protein
MGMAAGRGRLHGCTDREGQDSTVAAQQPLAGGSPTLAPEAGR